MVWYAGHSIGRRGGRREKKKKKRVTNLRTRQARGPNFICINTGSWQPGLSPANFDFPLEYRPERWLGSNTRDILEASQPVSLMFMSPCFAHGRNRREPTPAGKEGPSTESPPGGNETRYIEKILQVENMRMPLSTAACRYFKICCFPLR